MRCLIGMAVLLALSGCSAEPTDLRCTANTETAPTVGENFIVRYHESATIQGEGLTLRFAELVSDSRCPSGVVCGVAGNAEIRVSAAKGQEVQDFILNTDIGSPNEAAFQGYTVQLVGVAPYPAINHQLSAEAYCIELQVSQSAGI